MTPELTMPVIYRDIDGTACAAVIVRVHRELRADLVDLQVTDQFGQSFYTTYVLVLHEPPDQNEHSRAVCWQPEWLTSIKAYLYHHGH